MKWKTGNENDKKASQLKADTGSHVKKIILFPVSYCQYAYYFVAYSLRYIQSICMSMRQNNKRDWQYDTENSIFFFMRTGAWWKEMKSSWSSKNSFVAAVKDKKSTFYHIRDNFFLDMRIVNELRKWESQYWEQSTRCREKSKRNKLHRKSVFVYFDLSRVWTYIMCMKTNFEQNENKNEFVWYK